MSFGAFDRGYRSSVENHTPMNPKLRFSEEQKLQHLYIGYYHSMFAALDYYKNRYKTFIINYCAMIKNPVLYTRMLSANIDYPLQTISTIDANAKHYKRYR